jgi:protein phosphatase
LPLKIEVAGKTDVGLVRSGNEDFLHIDEHNGVYAVCDGMGGHQAGEVASRTASQTLNMIFDNWRQAVLDDEELAFGHTLPRSGDLLVKSIRLANRNIYRQSSADPGLAGMGTTIVSLAFEKDYVSIAHVGDSRAYRLDEEEIIQLTTDHSWVAEIQQQQQISEEDASTFVGKNIITRALGVRENVEVDYRLAKLQAGEIFVLCSDGLCGFVTNDEIYNVARRSRKNLQRMCEDLVELANSTGGQDNVTVIALRVTGVDKSDENEMDAITVPAESVEQLHAEDRWLEQLEKTAPDDEITQPHDPNVSHRSGGGSGFLYFLFAAFAVIAVVIAVVYGLP